MLSKTWAALAVALTLPLLNACGNEDANSGQVRNVNATTEYATMDLYDVDSNNDSSLLIGGTASNTVSPYSSLAKGDYTFNVVGAGGSSGAADVTGSVSKEDHYVVVTYITGSTLTNSFIGEEETAPTSGNAKLRVFNAASNDVGGVDVYVTSSDCAALSSTDTTLSTAVSGLQTSFSQILAPAGQVWNICITATGNQQDLRLAALAVPFHDGQISTLILTHTSGGVLLNGMMLDQQGALTPYANSLARVRVVADGAGAAAVNATINDVALSVNAASPTVGAYRTVPSGAATSVLSIGGVALADPGLTLTAGADYTLLVAGTPGASTVVLLPDSNTPSTSTALPVKMRLVNGVNGLATPASLSSDGIVVADSVAFGAASSYQNIAAATDSADLEAAAGSVALWSATSQTLTANAVYTVFLLGDYVPANVPPVTGLLRQDRAPSDSTTSTTDTTTTTGS